MRIDPVLAELRRDPAPQRAAQAALEACRDAWLQSPDMSAIMSELEAYGGGAALAECPALGNTLTGLGRANALINSLIGAMAAAMRRHPLGYVPFRHQQAAGISILQLAERGCATLSLVCYAKQSASERALAQTVCFTGGERHELCLAGAAQARFFQVLSTGRRRAELDCEPRLLEAGDRFSLSGARHTRIVDTPLERLVLLRLARTDKQPSPAREYRIDDGALVHVASGNRAESRAEMAAAVLGALGRADAVPVLAATAREGSDHLRWQLLRQVLALDTAAGFDLLTNFARDPGDPLAVPAGALRASLVERHPELAALDALCPA